MSDRGFTLLEVLVTVAILAFGVLALTRLQILSVQGTGFNKGATAATTLAQRAIEDYKAVAFGANPTFCGSDTPDGMHINCTVAPAAGTSAPYLVNEITVTVTWDDGRKSISLSTSIAQR